MEIWKDIENYKGIYQVSTFGRVKSLSRYFVRSNGEPLFCKSKILKPQIIRGYYYVRLQYKGDYKTILLSRLVAQAFIPNPDNLPEVNHKDENKLNNRVDNLEWCTRKYNINYGSHNEKVSHTLRVKGCLKGENNPMYGKPGAMLGKHHTFETKQHLRESALYRVWINDGTHTKRVKPEELDKYLSKGYVKGRLTSWQK